MGILSDIASEEEVHRATDKANKFGRDFKNESAKLVAQYFSFKEEANQALSTQQEIIEALKLKVESYLQDAFGPRKGDNSNIRFASELAAEYLSDLDISQYGNPNLPAADIYKHHPLVDRAAAFALTIYFLKWTRESF